MKKVYIVLGAGLIVLVLLIVIISLFGKSKITNKSAAVTTPTPYVVSTNNIQDITPVDTNDFALSYSPSLNQVIIEEKTANAKQSFFEWAYENNYPQLVDNNDLTSFITPTPADKETGSGAIIDLLNIFLNFGQGASSSTCTGQACLTPTSSINPSSTTNSLSSNLTYYYQCGEYGGYSLPSGCTLCSDGCGPTTVAMIAASYIDKNITPQTIVDLYKNHSYLLGCGGSRYSDAKTALESYGLKTTSYMIYNFESADTVVNDFRNYINSGWTIFTLVNLCQNGCGHFFWITDIDSQGNILAYDPFYGSTAIPYNENSRDPYPLYRLAFGVKKP